VCETVPSSHSKRLLSGSLPVFVGAPYSCTSLGGSFQKNGSTTSAIVLFDLVKAPLAHHGFTVLLLLLLEK
jgi:hypothetical protein